MRTYTSILHLDATPAHAFACVADPAAYAEMMNELGGFTFTVLEPAEGEGSRLRYEARVLGLPLGGTVTVTETVPGEELTLQWHGTERFVLGDLRAIWRFAPEEGGTTLTVRSEFGGTRVPLLDTLAIRETIRSFRAQELPRLREMIEARTPAA